MGILANDVSNLRVFDFLLRLFVIPLNVAAIWIAVTSKQDSTTFGQVLEFHNIVGLKYMVWISAISAGYAALSSALSSWLSVLATKAWLFLVADQVVAYLMVASMAAQGEFLYLAYKGDLEVTWSQACGSYGRFCNRLQLALVLHVFAVGCFLVLAVISAYRVFRRFEPPFAPSKEDADNHHHQHIRT